MRKHKQLLLHQPHNEIFGDCHRTALACLLNLEPHEVPHFVQLSYTQPEYDWQIGKRKWLNDRGLDFVDICFDNIENLFNFMDGWNPDALYLLGGRSPRGTDHTVIGHGGGFYHDPHPEGGFLVGPLSSGYYGVTFLVPKFMMEKSDV